MRPEHLPESSVVTFEYACPRCPGDGVVRPVRAGVDWPEPCPCEARRAFTQYHLGRILEEEPRAIVRVSELRAGGAVSSRVLSKLWLKGLVSGLDTGSGA